METVSVSLLILSATTAHVAFFVPCSLLDGFRDASARLPSRHSADDIQAFATLFLNLLLSAPNDVYGRKRRLCAALRTIPLLLSTASSVEYHNEQCWRVPRAHLSSRANRISKMNWYVMQTPASCTPSITAHPRYFRPQVRRRLVSVADVRGHSDGASRL